MKWGTDARDTFDSFIHVQREMQRYDVKYGATQLGMTVLNSAVSIDWACDEVRGQRSEQCTQSASSWSRHLGMLPMPRICSGTCLPIHRSRPTGRLSRSRAPGLPRTCPSITVIGRYAQDCGHGEWLPA